MQTKTFLSSLVAVLVAGAPLSGYGRDRDHHDRNHGHHGDRSSDHGHGHGHYYGGGYGRGYYGGGYGRGYYGGGYYGSYYSPYYRSRSWGPTFGLSFYSRPNYVYRGYVANDYHGSLAADVQSALRRRGYYHGRVDGSIGPASRAAIRAFQANRGLYITGRIDGTLLRALGIS